MAKTKQELNSYNRLSGREYDYWNGENHVNFLIVGVDVEKLTVTVIQSNLPSYDVALNFVLKMTFFLLFAYEKAS